MQSSKGWSLNATPNICCKERVVKEIHQTLDWECFFDILVMPESYETEARCDCGENIYGTTVAT